MPIKIIKLNKMIKIIKKKYPVVSFCIAGWFEENKNSSITRQFINHFINDNIVSYLGPISQESVMKELSECRYYVLPSYREGTPRTVLEAMATGRPIITTKVPGCKETVVDNLNGFLINPRSVDELVIAMEKMILLPSYKVEKMGEKSLEIARRKYDVNLVNRDMIEILSA